MGPLSRYFPSLNWPTRTVGHAVGGAAERGISVGGGVAGKELHVRWVGKVTTNVPSAGPSSILEEVLSRPPRLRSLQLQAFPICMRY